MILKLSTLKKVWILDVDGTIFVHNSYLSKGDEIIENFLDFYKQIPLDDYILIITSRNKKYKRLTIASLKKNNIRYDMIIFDAPKGERIVMNDMKPHGLNTAIAVSNKRDQFKKIKIKYDRYL